jgi:hypothetical protein
MEALMKSMPAGGFSPEVVRAAQAQASRMSPSDWEEAQRKMGSLPPEELQRQAAAANSQLAARQAYVLSASRTLKDEGNRLHAAKKFAEAAEKYKRARSNLTPAADAGAATTTADADPAAAAAAASAEGRELRRACALNYASCCLQLNKHAEAAEACEEVLQGDEGNVKALYRRGQARQALGQLQGAEEDLAAAETRTRESGGTEAQLAPIQAKLAEVRAARGRAKGEEAGKAAAAGAAAAAAAAATTAAAAATTTKPAKAAPTPKARTVSGSCVVEEADSSDDEEGRVEEDEEDARRRAEAEKARVAAAAAEDKKRKEEQERQERAKQQQQQQRKRPAATAPPQPSSSSVDADRMKQAAEMLRANPDLARQAADAMRGMTPEQLSAAMAASGASGVTPEQARMAAEMMGGMSTDEVAKMAEQAATMAAGGSGGAGAAATGAAAAAAGSIPRDQLEAQMRSMPEAIAKMSDEELERMAAAASGAGFGGGAAAGGPKVTPQMMRMAAEMMRGMKPEDMEAMQRMAATMGAAPGGAGGAGAAATTAAAAAAAAGPPSSSGAAAPPTRGSLPPDLMSRMADPAMMEQMFGMLQSMDERALAQMLRGMAPTDEAAQQLARRVKAMTPGQVRVMAKVASAGQQVAAAARKAKEALAGKWMLVLAVLVLVVAVVLRMLGWA